MVTLAGRWTLPAAAAALLAAGCGGDRVFQLAGTVERTALEVAAPVSEVIVAVPVERGQRVAAGEILVQLDTEVAEAEARAREAALAAAQALLAEAEGEFQRVKTLSERRVASTKELDRARRERDEALATAAEREARLMQAAKRLRDLTIRAPGAGVVDQLPFEAGERVPAGGVAAVVQTEDRPWVRVWLPSRAVAGVTAAARAEVSVEGLDRRLAGRLEDVAREPEFTPHYALTERESAHLVYRARIVLTDAPADLRPGLPARVKLILPRRAASDG
ncbi:MAG: efflux RND transporter periplasmic adaptor subunit [Acidobacteriota bacterium]|nr:efflux RND transporter periplasmic adaptor subunit [Acidobacteriota bacterium]